MKKQVDVKYPFGTVTATVENHKENTKNYAPYHSHLSVDGKRIDVHHQKVDINNPNKNK